jgi:hypothetical protein
MARNFPVVTTGGGKFPPVLGWRSACSTVQLFLFVSFALAQSTFPDPATLLKEIQANQHKMDDIRENYTFHRIVTEDDLDEKGAVIKTTTREREIFFVNGHRIGRLVKKDGMELKGTEEKNEQSRVKKLIEISMKAPPPKRRAGQFSMIGEILPVMKVSNPRRLDFHGRSTLAYDFTGDPQAKAKGTNENAAKKMAGTIWFDEADRQVARMEVHFYDNFRIGGGFLASVQKGTMFQIERSPIGEGLWMETSNNQHVSARIVVKNFRQNVHAKDFDFKKFNVEAVEQTVK